MILAADQEEFRHPGLKDAWDQYEYAITRLLLKVKSISALWNSSLTRWTTYIEGEMVHALLSFFSITSFLAAQRCLGE